MFVVAPARRAATRAGRFMYHLGGAGARFAAFDDDGDETGGRTLAETDVASGGQAATRSRPTRG